MCMGRYQMSGWTGPCKARREALADCCAYVQRHGSYQRSSCAESLPKGGFQGMIHVIPTARGRINDGEDFRF